MFKTPPFSDTSISRPSQVQVQLKRLSDGEVSDSLPFTYIPDESGESFIIYGSEYKLKMSITTYDTVKTKINVYKNK